MGIGGARNIKHHKQLEYYHSYKGEKCSYSVFFSRIHQQGLDYKNAIEPKKRLGQHMIKTKIDDLGRVCTNCGKYKLWDMFAKTKIGTLKRTPNCKKCRNKKKAEYRAKTNYQKDHEYKNRTRKLNIGQQLSFMEIVYIDGMPREEIRQVIDKKKMQGYKIKSLLTGLYKTLDTTEGNKNYKKFYKL